MFGYTAKQTLEAAQSLYEKKLMTYPRTDSRYLTEDMEETVIKVFRGTYRNFALFACGRRTAGLEESLSIIKK